MIRSKRSIQIVLSIMIFIVVLFCTTLSVYAACSRQEVTKVTTQHKYVKSILIESGDTLWSIAERFADREHYSNYFEYMNEVKRLNNLHTDRIKSGNHLMVVYYE